MRISLLLFLALTLSLIAEPATPALRQAIQHGFAAVRSLKQMRPGTTYSLPVDGVTEIGRKEQFLRRRGSDEILASKLSCGCGDNARVFLDHLERAGFETLLVDAAEISSASLLNKFSGHAVVAVREKPSKDNAPWHLVDSTNLKIISENWSPEEKSFQAFGRLFWIGYCGPASEYPVQTPDKLQRFYTTTLATVPPSVLASKLVHLNFTIDPSLLNPDKSLVNPHLSKFVELQKPIFQDNAITPTRTVPVLLKRGGDNSQTDLTFSEPEGWVALVGTKSGCSPSLLAYMEQMVKERLTAAKRAH